MRVNEETARAGQVGGTEGKRMRFIEEGVTASDLWLPSSQAGVESAVAEFFVEFHPGDALYGSIANEKERTIQVLDSQGIDSSNWANARFLRDAPHFTLWCNRTGNMQSMYDQLAARLRKLPHFSYEVIGTEFAAYPGGFSEYRTVVSPESQARFSAVQADIFDIVKNFRTHGDHTWFNPAGLPKPDAEHMIKYGYPNSMDRFRSHASVGRLSDAAKAVVEQGAVNWKPQGRYEVGPILIGVLPFQHNDATNSRRAFYRDPIYLR